MNDMNPTVNTPYLFWYLNTELGVGKQGVYQLVLQLYTKKKVLRIVGYNTAMYQRIYYNIAIAYLTLIGNANLC